MKVIIMAGGKGTRIASIASDTPKPMIPIFGKVILEHQIDCLKKNGLTEITIVTGHLGNQIKEHFGDGSIFGCKISYFNETEPLGTAGALYKMDNIHDDFILLNGDVIFDIDFSRMINFHKQKKAWASLAVHPNDHPFDSALIEIGDNDQVTGWMNKEDKRTYHKNLINAGIHIISKDLIANAPQLKEKIDLDRDMLKPAIHTGKIFAYKTPEYIKDMGTAERYTQVSKDMENGTVKQKNLKARQKCVFLDRDGTINKFNGFITKPEDFDLIEGTADAIKKINSLGYLVIVITNQPIIARGEADVKALNLIHMKMETMLGEKNAYIDDLFYCPHHPDKGFEGERPEYKIVCDCRKPKPGLILQAAKKFNIDLSKSYMTGDHNRDIECAVNAGCKPVFISNGEGKAEDIKSPDIQVFANLTEFAGYLQANGI